MSTAVSSSTANGSVSNSGTYIRSQYNGLNPPPAGGAASHNTSLLSDRLDHHMDISLASPDDLPPPGYDPSLTDGPPSTIGDPGRPTTKYIVQEFYHGILCNANTELLFVDLSRKQ